MDDDPEVRMVLHDCLHSAGYQVMMVPDGELGLDLALRERPDLLVVDMMMPRLNGFRVLESFRNRCGRHTPFLMISANAELQHSAYARNLGADAFLGKPFTIDQFMDCVARLCPVAAPSYWFHEGLETPIR